MARRISAFSTWDSLVRRGIMTTPEQRAKEAVDALKGNPYYEKYAKKISDLQKTSPEELLSRLAAFEEKKKLKKRDPADERAFSSPMTAKPDVSQMTTKPKALADVMKMELVQDKSADEIKQIWEEYNKHKDYIAAVIPSDSYALIKQGSQQYRTFLFPLPRSQGYEFIVCQFEGDEAHFTPLIAYQAHKESAPECLTITHYTEFQEKGIILMRGEFNKEVLNVTEAQCLANQVQLYYGQEDKVRLAIMETFTKRPDEFKHMDLIAQLETLSFK